MATNVIKIIMRLSMIRKLHVELQVLISVFEIFCNLFEKMQLKVLLQQETLKKRTFIL